MRFSASIEMAVPRALVRQVICDVSKIGTWNPAITRVNTADEFAIEGRTYRAEVRYRLPVRIHYSEIADHVVDFTISGAGECEVGHWFLEQSSLNTTRVTHSFEHFGVLLWMLRPAFASVASWRLARLEREARRRLDDALGEHIE